ncbi:MAG: OmpA family protein, partial [Spirochaeta sp.]|nr:OmpA family protein [Spirochaeta sp.]
CYDAGAEGAPPQRIRWDGRARNGEQVLSAETYRWRLEVADVLGNTTVREGDLPVDVLVEPYQGGYRIQVPSITFPPNSAELRFNGDNEVAAQNQRVIERIVEILSRFPEYSIVVEGHAVNISGTEREQEQELIPLSRRRAQAVRDALIDRGVPATIVDAVGRGGAVPIVDHADEEMRWKNRRVDFILQR